MKGFILIIFIAAVILLAVQFFKTGPDDKSNFERSVDSLDKAKITLNAAGFINVKRALVLYRSQKGNYPDDLADLIPDFLNNRSQLEDSWGNPLQLISGNGYTSLVSKGPDGRLNTSDDQKFPL